MLEPDDAGGGGVCAGVWLVRGGGGGIRSRIRGRGVRHWFRLVLFWSGGSGWLGLWLGRGDVGCGCGMFVELVVGVVGVGVVVGCLCVVVLYL